MIFNVEIPVIALVEADSPAEAIDKAHAYLRASAPAVEVYDGKPSDAFESEDDPSITASIT